MRFASRFLASVCVLATTLTHASELIVDGIDLRVAYDPTQFQLPPSSIFDASDFQMYARSEGSGDAVGESGSTSFSFNLTNRNVHLVGLTLEARGNYALRGPGSVARVDETMSVVGLGVPGASSLVKLAGASPFVDDGTLLAWSMLGTSQLWGRPWDDVRSIAITLDTRLVAFAPNAPGAYAYITAQTGGLKGITEYSSSGYPTAPVGEVMPTPLPRSLFMLGSGLLVLVGWAGLRRST